MPAKPIRISPHAHFEMRRRSISPTQVIAMIRRPGQVLPAAKGRHIYQGFIGQARRLLLRVVVREEDRAYHVVTAYKTSRVSKYWSGP
jgi:Domain of unknown function (DUF4258)